MSGTTIVTGAAGGVSKRRTLMLTRPRPSSSQSEGSTPKRSAAPSPPIQAKTERAGASAAARTKAASPAAETALSFAGSINTAATSCGAEASRGRSDSWARSARSSASSRSVFHVSSSKRPHEEKPHRERDAPGASSKTIALASRSSTLKPRDFSSSLRDSASASTKRKPSPARALHFAYARSAAAYEHRSGIVSGALRPK